MRLILAGKNNIAVDVLDSCLRNFDIPIQVIVNKTENFKNSWQKSLGFHARLWNVPIVELNEIYEMEEIIFISVEFDQLIKPKLFKSNKLYNIHFSLLPKYKGMFTSAWPILNNENETGVTFHEIDAGIDTGDIIEQTKIKIDGEDTARDLYSKYIIEGTNLVIKNIPNLISQNVITRRQSRYNSTWFSLKSINYDNLKIDYFQTAFKITVQLRAFSFREYQLPRFKKHYVNSWKITKNKSLKKAGTVIEQCNDYAIISSIDYDLIIYFDCYDRIWECCRKDNFIELNHILNNKDINLETKTNEGWTALIIAVYNGSMNCIKSLIEKGADINASNYNLTSVIMYAKDYSISNNYDLIIYLIKFKPNLKHKDIYGKTVFDWAEEQDSNISKILNEYV